MRRPGVIIWLLFALTLSNVLTLFWTIAVDETSSIVLSYVQLFAMVWVVWEVVRLPREAVLLIFAYCAGAYVSIVDTLLNFATGAASTMEGRFAGANLNPNEFGAILAIGIPFAWFLFLTQRGLYRLAAAAYLPLAMIAILLTASRGAFLAGLVAMSVVPLTLSRRSLRSWSVAVVILIVGAGAASTIVPAQLWNRIFTATDEVSTGTFGGRVSSGPPGSRLSRRVRSLVMAQALSNRR
jgi:hypothetical protein